MLTLPILQTVILTAVLLGAGRLVDRPVAAAATVGLLWVRQAVESAITPPLINASVVAAGLTYRWPGGMQNLGANAPLAPLLLLPAVSAVELALWVPGLGSPAARAMIAGALVAAVQLATAPLSIGLETLAIEPLARVAPEVVGTAGAGMRALSTLPMAGPAAVCFGVFVALAVERWVHPTAVP
jgi:hypothetical protein